MRRDFKSVNMNQFVADYTSMNWDRIIEIEHGDVDHSITCFLKESDKIINTFAPLRKTTNKEYKQSFKPWINRNIRGKIIKKDKLFNKYVKCRNKDRKSYFMQNLSSRKMK